MRGILRRAVVAAILIGAALAAPAPAHAQAGCTPKLVVGKTTYDARICDVPDYDQKRFPNTPPGGASLKGSGRCYCVPTTITDLLGYYAQHGVDVAPGAFDWDGRGSDLGPHSDGFHNWTDAEKAAFNAVGNVLALLGTVVTDTPSDCGTSYQAVLAMHSILADTTLFRHARFDTQVLADGAISGRKIAVALQTGGTVGVAYGRYPGYVEHNGIATAMPRSGGHSVAVGAIKGDAVSATLTVLDPGTDPEDAPGRQGTFGRDPHGLRKVLVTTTAGKTFTGWRYGPLGEPGDTQRVVDGMVILFPTMLVTVGGKNLGFMPGVAFNRSSRSSTRASLVPPRRTFTLPEPIADAAPLPAGGEIAVLLARSHRVMAVSVADGTRRLLADGPAGATQLEADPVGERIYVAGRSALVALDEQGRQLKRTPLSAPVGALAFDWSAQDPADQRLASCGPGRAPSPCSTR